jgi:flagellar basal-body rod protein FlgC
MFRTLDVSASGLAAQRVRMDTIAGNIAHSHTTQDENGNHSPFQRRMTVLEAQTDAATQSRGVGVKATVEIDTQSPTRKVLDPGHPHADAEGFVQYPNVNIITESVNAMEASRAYEANISTMQVTRDMIENTFRLLG